MQRDSSSATERSVGTDDLPVRFCHERDKRHYEDGSECEDGHHKHRSKDEERVTTTHVRVSGVQYLGQQIVNAHDEQEHRKPAEGESDGPE
jgi:hypothetical protein